MTQSNESKYPVGGYAPGNYYCNCSTCNEKFQGDKRSFQCEPCGTKSQAEWDALTPDEQAERVRKNIEIYREFENQQKTMKQSNSTLPAESNWKLTLHEQVERPYYEITNGPISLCASCGFVGETEEDEDAIFKNVAQVLNDSGIDFHSENELEFKQHIEIMQLQTDVDHWKREHQELQAQAQRMADALAEIAESNCDYESMNYAKALHSPECRACKAKELLQQFKDGKGKATDKNEPMNNKELTASYTKGEWYLQEYTDAYTNIVRCNGGKGYETLFIAYTPQGSLPEYRANAQLMSAAPDLLKSLQEIIAITDRDHVAWDKAKGAIEKAIGNTNPQK